MFRMKTSKLSFVSQDLYSGNVMKITSKEKSTWIEKRNWKKLINKKTYPEHTAEIHVLISLILKYTARTEFRFIIVVGLHSDTDNVLL